MSDANENAELVADCETLLGLRDDLAGTALLNWVADTPIADWDGVSVGGSPMRVTGLELDDMGLNGEIPSGMGRLSGLEVLSLSENKFERCYTKRIGQPCQSEGAVGRWESTDRGDTRRVGGSG